MGRLEGNDRETERCCKDLPCQRRRPRLTGTEVTAESPNVSCPGCRFRSEGSPRFLWHGGRSDRPLMKATSDGGDVTTPAG